MTAAFLAWGSEKSGAEPRPLCSKAGLDAGERAREAKEAKGEILKEKLLKL